MSINLHVYQAPIVHESRLLKETSSVERAGLFDRVIICGVSAKGLEPHQRLSERRTVERVGPVHRRSRSVLRRILGQLSWSRLVFRRFRAESELEAINAHSVAVLPLCARLARRHGAKLVYDTHELETESGSARGLQQWIYRVIERTFIRRCDLVFVVNESIAAWYANRYPGIETVVIRNVPEVPESIRPRNVRAQLGIPEDRRVFVHVGNLSGGRSLPVILEAFAAAEIEDHLVLLGGGVLPVEAQASAQAANVHLVPPIPANEVVDFVAGCDVGFCLIEPGPLSRRLSLPNKAFEYATAGVPFFFTDLPEVERLLGPGFASWKVADPATELRSALTGLTDDMIAAGAAALRAMDLPTWESEADTMIDAYRRRIVPAEAAG